MSQRKTQVLAAFGVLSFLTMVGATAATSQNLGIDVYNGDVRMHGNDMVNPGLVDGVDLSNPGSNIQVSGSQYAVQDSWIDESGDSISGSLKFNGEQDTYIAKETGELAINSEEEVRIVSDRDASDVPSDIVMRDGSSEIELDGDATTTNNLCVINDATLNCDGSKNWIHALNSTHEAVYSSQESPEVRAVYEGNTSVHNSVANVTLPRHFSETVSDSRPSLRIQVTPHELASVAVTERTSDYIVIEASEDVNVDFRVTGIREGYEDKQVVQKKDESGGGN